MSKRRKCNNSFKQLIKENKKYARNSGHRRDCEKVSGIERCPLHRGSSQICLFCSKNRYFATKICFGVLGHCKIDTTVK